MNATRRPSTDTVSYRWTSLALVATVLLAPVAAVAMGAPRWVAVLVVALPAYVTLFILTWRRLRAIGRNPGWTALMLVVVRIGPHWEGPGALELYLTNLLFLIPVALGWFAHAARPSPSQDSNRPAPSRSRA